jgi:hypothetical protein
MKNIPKNKYIPIIFGILLMLGITSCEDKLNEPYQNIVFIEDVDYSIGSDMILPLLGAYEAFYSIGWDQNITFGVRGDDVNAAGDQAPMQEQDNYLYLSSHWNLNSLMTIHYSRTIRMFTAISEIEKYRAAAGNDALADQYIAECRVMRAWFYYLQALSFGGGVIIDQLDNIQLQPASNKADMMQYIVDEIEEVASLLPAVHPAKRTDIKGGLTKYTALAIQALAYQELEDYQSVADATSEIINSGEFDLAPDYYDLFNSISSKLGEEFILEFQRSDYGQATGDIFNGGALFNPYGIGGWTPAVAGTSAGWGFYEPSLKYIKFMLDRGEKDRLETTVEFTPDGITELLTEYGSLPSWIDNMNREGDIFNNNGRLKFGSGKFIQPSTEYTSGRNNSIGANKNWIGIRYAEILLIHAEALTRGASGSAISALEAINEVRSRANLTQLSSVTTEDVLDEKLAELATERGIRFYDMIRTENTAELSHEGKVFTMDKAYYPFPIDQVSELPQLADGVQN